MLTSFLCWATMESVGENSKKFPDAPPLHLHPVLYKYSRSPRWLPMPLPPVVYVWPLPLWIRTTCLTEKTLRNDSVWLLRLGRKRHDGFHWLFDHLFRGMPTVCCEGIRATLQRNPCGERLRPPAHSHVCVPSWKRSPWVQMTTTPGNVMTVNVWRTESELPS